MLRTSKILGIILMLLTPMAKAWAVEQVVTIYFAGTGINADWWQSEHTSWQNNPELLATLFHEQNAASFDQHKLFVAGIGARPDCNFSNELIQKGLPLVNICRNWEKTLNEAKDFLEQILDDEVMSGDSVICRSRSRPPPK